LSKNAGRDQCGPRWVARNDGGARDRREQFAKAGAWVAEKVSRIKLQLEDEETGEIGLLQASESLVFCIKGKEVLWRALGAVQGSWPPLQRFNFTRIEKRAIEQGASFDEKRMQTASQALRPVLASFLLVRSSLGLLSTLRKAFFQLGKAATRAEGTDPRDDQDRRRHAIWSAGMWKVTAGRQIDYEILVVVI
jgi:hypothetical protein